MKLKRSIVANTLMIVLSGLLLQLDGCTLAGLGVGAMADAERPKAGVVSGRDWTIIKPRTPIVVRLIDSADVKGRFIRTTLLPSTRYSPLFMQCRASDSALATLPAPGDTVTVTLISGRQVTGRLEGYDRRRTAEKVTLFAWIAPVGDTAATPVDLDSTVGIWGGSSQSIDVARVRRFVSRHEFPSVSAITVQSPATGVIDIPVDRIARISYPHRHGAVTGLLIGLGIDLAIVVTVAATEIISFGPM